MAVQRTLIGNIKGPKGDKGDTGDTGAHGAGATVTIGSVTTTVYGGNANVTNSGTSTDAVLDFVIPQGAPGETVTDMENLTLSSMTEPSVQFPTPSIGDNGKTLFGKITKWFSDMRTLVNTKLNIANLVNGFTQTTTGTHALDAAAGKTLNDKINKYADGTVITNANNAPLGFSSLNQNSANNPFPNFWCTILTMKGNSDSAYTQQIAFPWAVASSGKIAYRVYDNSRWHRWNYLDDTYVQSSLILENGLSWNGYQTIQFFGQVAVIHINFWSTTALSSGAKIVTLPSSHTYDFPGHYAASISGSTGGVCTFNVTSAGVMTIETTLAANAHVDLLLIGRAI